MIESQGVLAGILAFIFIFLLVFNLLKKYRLNTKMIMQLTLLSAIGHFLGSIAYYIFTLNNGSDSLFYFKSASLHSQGFGYFFAFYILGILKQYVLGESLLGAFLVSGACAFLGSVFYLLTYKVLLDKLYKSRFWYLYDAKQLNIPAFLLLCWPSYFFWSAGLIKDNFAFFSIGLFLWVIARGKFTLMAIINISLACLLGFMIRPYLFVILSITIILYLMMGSKWNIFAKISAFITIFSVTTLIIPQLIEYTKVLSLTGMSVNDLAKFAMRQQSLMNIGSSIPVPTQNPYLAFFFLPYLFCANLILPLGIGANNLIGIISSLENAYLFGWLIYFFKHRHLWQEIKTKLKILNFFLIYFMIGISCLSIVNTNLGVAMREKMMYVPAVLICIFLVYAYERKIKCELWYQPN